MIKRYTKKICDKCGKKQTRVTVYCDNCNNKTINPHIVIQEVCSGIKEFDFDSSECLLEFLLNKADKVFIKGGARYRIEMIGANGYDPAIAPMQSFLDKLNAVKRK
jgi:hypothetical protein